MQPWPPQTSPTPVPARGLLRGFRCQREYLSQYGRDDGDSSPSLTSPDKNGSVRAATSAPGPGAGIPSREPPRCCGTQQPSRGTVLAPRQSRSRLPARTPSARGRRARRLWLPAGAPCRQACGALHVQFPLAFTAAGLPAPAFVGSRPALHQRSPGKMPGVVSPAAQLRGTAEGTGQHRKTCTVVMKTRSWAPGCLWALNWGSFLPNWGFVLLAWGRAQEKGENSGQKPAKPRQPRAQGCESAGRILCPVSPAAQAGGQPLRQHGAGRSSFHLPVSHLAEEETADGSGDVEVTAAPMPSAKGAPTTAVYEAQPAPAPWPHHTLGTVATPSTG